MFSISQVQWLGSFLLVLFVLFELSKLMYCNVEYITTSNWSILFTVQYIAQLYIVQLQDKNHIQPIISLSWIWVYPRYNFRHFVSTPFTPLQASKWRSEFVEYLNTRRLLVSHDVFLNHWLGGWWSVLDFKPSKIVLILLLSFNFYCVLYS